MRHYNQRYAFVSSALLDASAGIGASPLVLGLMAALAKKGKKVALVAPPPALRLPESLTFTWFNLRAVRALSDLAVDVVIGFDGDGHRFARAPRTPPFVAFLTGGLGDFAGALPGRAGGRSRRSLLSAVRSADLLVVTSRHAVQQAVEMTGLAPERVAALSPGVDPEEWRARAFPEHDRPRVFAVASGARDDEFAWLVGACVEARRRIGDLELQVCGAEHPRLWQRSAFRSGLPPEAVTIDSRSRRSDLKAELGACDVFVQLAQRSGGAPHWLWAMALGRPVIVPDTPELRELSDGAAASVPPLDTGALGAMLADMLASRATAKEWVRRGAERAANATWGDAAQRFGERLAEL